MTDAITARARRTLGQMVEALRREATTTSATESEVLRALGDELERQDAALNDQVRQILVRHEANRQRLVDGLALLAERIGAVPSRPALGAAGQPLAADDLAWLDPPPRVIANANGYAPPPPVEERYADRRAAGKAVQ